MLSKLILLFSFSYFLVEFILKSFKIYNNKILNLKFICTYCFSCKWKSKIQNKTKCTYSACARINAHMIHYLDGWLLQFVEELVE
jgi:hypothetical protein